MLAEDLVLPYPAPPHLHHLCTVRISEHSDQEDARIGIINNVLTAEGKTGAQHMF